MTHFLEDILRQPQELDRSLDHLSAGGRPALQSAANAIRNSRYVYLTGIGSSWNAAFGAGAIFSSAARPVFMQDAGELIEFANVPPESVIIAISRSGRSVEIVNLLAKARESNAQIVGITCSPDGALAQEAQFPILLPTARDHAVSVNTYVTLATAAAALASAVVDSFSDKLSEELRRATVEAARTIPQWQQQLAGSDWFSPGALVHFLARGGSLASCHEARLLWEEAAKAEATGLETSSFRHGPQEIVVQGSRFAMWIDAQRARKQDLSVAQDLGSLGAAVLLIGQNLSSNSGSLVLQLPQIPAEWQFMIDVLPAQLAAEHLARLSGVDCDSFRICSYIVESDLGLLASGGRG